MTILKGQDRTPHKATQNIHTQKKTVEKERQQKKAKYANINQRKVKACTKLSDNLYSVSSANEAHKLIDDFETRSTIKSSCNKASKGFGGTGE